MSGSSSAQLPGLAGHLSAEGLIGVTWTGAVLGMLFTATRFAIRIKRMRGLMADDYFVLAALIFLIINAILQTLQVPHMYYMISDYRGPDIMYHGLQYTIYEFVIISVFWTVLWCIKGSFLALFYMLLDGLPHYRRYWWGVVVFTGLAYIGCWLASVFTCHPPSDYFKFGHCTKPIDVEGSKISITYSTAVDILSDLMIMSLPFGVLYKAKISARQKGGLAVVFCLGFLIITAALVRAINIVGSAMTDPVALAIWGIAESSISLIVGCLPPFKTFLASRGNSTRYASSGFNPNHYSKPPTSSRVKKRSMTTSWSEAPIQLQGRHDMYQNLDSHVHSDEREHHTQISSGSHFRGMRSQNESIITKSEEDSQGEIRMVQEFSVVTSK